MLVKVKAIPGASEEMVIEKYPDQFEIYVREPPAQGRATKAVTRALANYLKIPLASMRLVKGARERNKIFEIKTK